MFKMQKKLLPWSSSHTLPFEINQDKSIEVETHPFIYIYIDVHIQIDISYTYKGSYTGYKYMARKSLCEASIASLGDIYKKVHRSCAGSHVPRSQPSFWEVQSQFTYWNLADRFRDFKAFCIFGDFNYSSNQCNNPVLRVLCPFVVYFPYLRDRSIWAKRSNPNIYIYFPLFPPNSAIYSKGDGWDLQGHPLQRVTRASLTGKKHTWRLWGSSSIFWGAIRSVHILWKQLGSNFNPWILSHFVETIGLQLQPSISFSL